MANLTEKDVARIWQYQLLERDRLATEDGEPLRVIYPGRPNDEEGADFRQAVVIIGVRLLRGDVEIHIRSSGWQEHGHNRDVSYNRVILHVVMWHNRSVATRLQNGGEVPVLALERYVAVPVSQGLASGSSSGSSNLACFRVAERTNAEAAAELLDRAGDERFLVKGAWFQKDLARWEAGQSLYQGMMVALGYARNKLPFLELARRLPLRLLESLSEDKIPAAEWLLSRQALLLGMSGLLFSQPQDAGPGNRLSREWAKRLGKLWDSYPHPGAMSPDVWHLMRVRPSNSPIVRLVAMSYLLLRYREKGLLEGLVRLVSEAPSGRGGYKSLEAGLEVTFDSGPVSGATSGASGRVNRLAWLGRGRAADIIVNVLLPFTFAWSQSTAEPELGSKALDLYRLYPRLSVNSVERQMREQLRLDSSLVNSARRQQGLIHIHKNFCSQGRCERCQNANTKPHDDEKLILPSSGFLTKFDRAALISPLSHLQPGHDIQVQPICLAGPEAEVAAGSNHGGVVSAQFHGRDENGEGGIL